MLEQRIEQDLKTALLAGDVARVSTLRLVKSVILNAKVASGKRETGLEDQEVLSLLGKESKKRQESADLYLQAKDQTRADQELAEKAIIDAYLPEQLSESQVTALVDEAVQTTGASSQADMGKVIGLVRSKAGAAADGALIARLVKEKLGL